MRNVVNRAPSGPFKRRLTPHKPAAQLVLSALKDRHRARSAVSELFDVRVGTVRRTDRVAAVLESSVERQ